MVVDAGQDVEMGVGKSVKLTHPSFPDITLMF